MTGVRNLSGRTHPGRFADPPCARVRARTPTLDPTSPQTWWQRHRDLTLIVAGRTDACAASAKTNRKDTHG